MNRFAQLLYGEVIFIFETEMPMEQLSTIFSPQTYWVDVTNKECDVGDVVTFDNEKGFVFSKPTTTIQNPTIVERVTSLEDAVNMLIGGETIDG
jgi:hypothetical protein